MRINKPFKMFFLFCIFFLASTTDNYPGAFANQATVYADELLMVAGVVFASLSMKRPAPSYDPSHSQCLDIRWIESTSKPVTIDPNIQRMIYNDRHARVFPSYKHILGQQPQAPVVVEDRPQGQSLAGGVPTTKPVTSVAASKPSYSIQQTGPMEWTLSGDKAWMRAGFSNDVSQAQERSDQVIKAHDKKVNPFRRLKAIATLNLENNVAGMLDPVDPELIPVRAKAREQIEAIKDICDSFIAIGIHDNKIQPYAVLSKLYKYVETYKDDEDFFPIINQLFGEPIRRVVDECFDKETGELTGGCERNKLVANLLLDLAKNKVLFEFLVNNSRKNAQHFDFASLVEHARKLDVRDVDGIQRLQKNKLLNRRVPNVSETQISQCVYNPANDALLDIRKYLNDEKPYLSFAQGDLRYLGEVVTRPSSVYSLAQSEYNRGVAKALEFQGIAPYTKHPLWTQYSVVEQMKILEDNTRAYEVLCKLKDSHDHFADEVVKRYKFPKKDSLTQEQQKLFADLTEDLVYKTAPDRTRYLIDGVWNSTDPKQKVLKKRLFLPNGILKADADSHIARTFKLDTTQSKAVQNKLLYELNNLLSYDASDPAVKNVVNLGLRATVRANSLTGSEAVAWSRVQVAVNKYLEGNRYYASLRFTPKLSQMKDVLQEVLPSVRECQRAELKNQNSGKFSESFKFPDSLERNPDFRSLLPATRYNVLFDGSDVSLDVQLQCEHQTYAAQLLADKYNVEFWPNASLFVPLSRCTNSERNDAVSFLFEKYVSGDVSAEMVRAFNVLYGEDRICHEYDDFEWVKGFKLNPKHSVEFQNQTARLANKLLFEYQNTLAIQNIAQLERGTGNEEWISSLNARIAQGLDYVAQANAQPEMAAGLHQLAFESIHDINKLQIELFPEYTDQLFPQLASPLPYDAIVAMELGENNLAFQAALNSVHIHFNPEDFSAKEVDDAMKLHRKFHRGLVWQPLYHKRQDAGLNVLGDIKLNTDLDPKIQEALVLTANRLLAIRTDLENASHIDRALLYVKLANNISEENAPTYLDTAEAMYKALRGNQAYAPFLSLESLPKGASVEVQKSLFEACRQEELESHLVMPCDDVKEEPPFSCGVQDDQTVPELECGTQPDKEVTEFTGPSKVGGSKVVELPGPCVVVPPDVEPLHIPQNKLPSLGESAPTVEVGDEKGEPAADTDAAIVEDGVVVDVDSESTETDVKTRPAVVEEAPYVDFEDVDIKDLSSIDEEALEKWMEARFYQEEMDRLWPADIDFNDPAHSQKLQECIERLRPLVEHFNTHPAVKKLGIHIDIETLVHHVTHGHVRFPTKNVTGVHDSQMENCCFEAVVSKVCAAHGETEASVRPINPELRAKYEEKRMTTRFGPGWDHERIIKVILDAIVYGRVDGSKRKAGIIPVTTKCGMIIELKLEKDKTVIGYYPEIKWMRSNPMNCNGKCHRDLQEVNISQPASILKELRD